MTMQWLLGWWNLIFVAPFAVALVYLGVYTLTGITFGEADVDAEMDADVDAHVDVDADADADTDADPDADADADGDHDADAEDAGGAHASLQAMALGWLGAGRVPLSLVIMVLMLTWGFAGLAT